MAQLISPEAEISVKGFEQTRYFNDSFNLESENVPFGNYSITTKPTTRKNFNPRLLAKTIYQVRPGGWVAVITFKGTLDKKDVGAWKYFS